jgi:polysaccharide chain length determinant protein (PEP-CTERM system associated)
MLPGRSYPPEDILALLWKRRWWVLVPFAVCTLLGLLVSRFLPNRYQSDTLIQVVPQRVPTEYVKPTVTVGLEDRLQSLTQEIMSRTRLERIIEEFNLYPKLRARGIMQDVVDGMRKDIKVGTTKGGARNDQVDSFTIAYTAEDPAVAQKVTERLAGLFIDENLKDRGNLAEATTEFLESQLTEARARLEGLEAKLKEFRQRHAGALPSQLESNMQAINTTQLQLQALVESLARDRDRKLMLERLRNDTQSELSAMRTSAPLPQPNQAGPGGQATEAIAGATAAQQLESARATLAQMELRLKPGHPDIRRMKRVISDLEKKADAESLQQPLSNAEAAAPVRATSPEEAQKRAKVVELSAEIESLGRQIEFKEGEERRIRGVIGGYQSRIEMVPGLESEWVSLSRDYETTQKAYADLLAKSEDSRVAANLERRQIGEQFKVLDPARVPERPISPNRRMINGGALALGLGLGLLLIGLSEYRDSGFRTDTEVVRVLELPVLAVVPLVTSRAAAHRAKRRHRLLAWGGTFVFLLVAAGLTWSLKLWNYVL